MRTPPLTAAEQACDGNTKKFIFRAICFLCLYLQVASPWHCSVVDVLEHRAEDKDRANRPHCGQWWTVSHCQAVQRGGNPHSHPHLRPPPDGDSQARMLNRLNLLSGSVSSYHLIMLKCHHIWNTELGELLRGLKWGQVNLEEIYPF